MYSPFGTPGIVIHVDKIEPSEIRQVILHRIFEYNKNIILARKCYAEGFTESSIVMRTILEPINPKVSILTKIKSVYDKLNYIGIETPRIVHILNAGNHEVIHRSSKKKDTIVKYTMTILYVESDRTSLMEQLMDLGHSFNETLPCIPLDFMDWNYIKECYPSTINENLMNKIKKFLFRLDDMGLVMKEPFAHSFGFDNGEIYLTRLPSILRK